jgi:hypothetical protein
MFSFGANFKYSSPQNSNKGILYVYHLYEFCGVAFPLPVFLNNQKIVYIKNNGYTKVELNKGKYNLAVKRLGDVIAIDTLEVVIE